MNQAEPWEGRRVIGWAVVAALCVAALVAIQAILTGDFGSGDARVIGLSIGFGVFTATGGAGAALTSRMPSRYPALGQTTVMLSVVSFLLLAAALWADSEGDTWRWFVSAAVTTLALAHWCSMSINARDTDSSTVELARASSVVLGVVTALLGVLAASGAVDAGGGYYQFVAVVIVLLLLATTLVPILRRLDREGPHAAHAPTPAAPTQARARPPLTAAAASLSFATEIMEAAKRIEALTDGDSDASARIREECERLRELARTYSR